MGFGELLEEVSHCLLNYYCNLITVRMNTPVQVDQVWCRCVTCVSWWGGRVRQVPVDPRDSDQFTWFDDGESEPDEQLRLRNPCPPLQSANQLQPPQPVSLPGNPSVCQVYWAHCSDGWMWLVGLVGWTWLVVSGGWEAAAESVHPSGLFRK